ncbi:MAG: STAS domain-containing protein [Proteobacteria bacterium]|nr:STAS domain-containing protein [Pseudomonadota bacterium]MCL2308430.1 STAS domain-containing protein [Pseudomonadota bacterium]
MTASAATAAQTTGFYVDGARWRCRGALTLDNSADVLKESETLLLPTSGVIDLSELNEADSAALAVFLSLVRRAESEGKTLQFEAAPEALRTLAHVYGVDSLLVLTHQPLSKNT